MRKIVVTAKQVAQARVIVKRAEADGRTPRPETILIASAPSEGGTITV